MGDYQFDVFLNYRGPDVRNSFVDFLCYGLTAAGVNVFRDSTSLVGRTIRPGLHGAIQSSRIAIPTISPQYKQSEWCLDELVKIMDCHGRNRISVFPVFYRVDVVDATFHTVEMTSPVPSKLIKTFTRESALASVRQIRGWISQNIANGNEAELADMVVAKVSSELKAMQIRHPAGSRTYYLLSSFSSLRKWQVFLAFRGPNTRYGFTAYLYKGLVRAQIRVFIFDDPSLIGKDFRGEIHSAIEQSRISIPILSENYASSSWCLEELAQMVECRITRQQTILPIFYKGSPSDVRDEGSRFHRDMSRHVREPANYSRWRQALERVGNAGGWVSEQVHNGREAALVELVIEEVRKLLDMPLST